VRGQGIAKACKLGPLIANSNVRSSLCRSSKSLLDEINSVKVSWSHRNLRPLFESAKSGNFNESRSCSTNRQFAHLGSFWIAVLDGEPLFSSNSSE